ncbi:MAG: biosynthetic-type acetolactate synthase large subunit [Blastocatellia bacterium]
MSAPAIEPLLDSDVVSIPRVLRGSRILCEALIREGVDTVFGYPGGAVLHIYDDLAKVSDRLRHVLARHEQGAIHMAEGYAKATGKVGVALVTSGPGATNAVTGIANAFMDSTPLVVITGQVPTKMIGSDAFQEVDTVGITRPCTKYNYLVDRVEDLATVIKEAFYIASTGRPGPVVIDIPKDVSGTPAEFDYPDEINLRSYDPVQEPDEAQVQRAVELIRNARRPLLYVGGGIVHSNASAELIEFAERLSIPVTPTLMGLGAFPSGHKLSLGMLGMHGTYWANMAISDADVIAAIGVRFDDRVTGALEKFAPHARIVHVDIDESSIDKNVKVEVRVVGDARTVLHRMLAATAREPGDRLDSWWRQIDEWKQLAPLSSARSDRVIMPQHLLDELRQLTAPDAIVATDVGQHQMWLAQYYPFSGPRLSLTSGGLGTMGFGFPAALGAQLAFPSRQVIAFVGDGGFQMTSQELACAVQYGTNVKIIIMNNNFLGMVRQWQEIFYDGNYSHVCTAGLPDFVKLAEAYGATGLRVSRPEELKEVLERGLNTPGVVVMDVVVAEEENVFPMIPPGAGLKEMVLG